MTVWIESHSALANHPKTLRFARTLGISRAQAIGHLHLLWWWAFEYAPDGDLSSFDPAEIEAACDWNDTEKSLFSALGQAGFVDAIDQSPTIHDWKDYVGKLLKQRRKARDRMRRTRRERSPHVRVTFAERVGDLTDQTRPDRPDQTDQTRPTTAGAGARALDGFAEFWTAYPRKVKKQNALAEWKRLRPDQATCAAIMAGLERWMRSEQWAKDDGAFVVYPERFLKHRRWEDEVSATPAAGGKLDMIASAVRASQEEEHARGQR